MPAPAGLVEVGGGCARYSDPSSSVARASLRRLARPAGLLMEGYSPLWSPSVKASQRLSRKPQGEDGIASEVEARWPKRSLFTPDTTL